MTERDHERGELNLGCEELLLDPDQLSRLLYEDDRDRKPSRESQRDVGASDNDKNKEERVIQVRSVLPDPNNEDNDNIVTNHNHNNNDVTNENVNDNDVTNERVKEEEVKTEAKLPPVRLHKVQSEDLTWLDTIIKHNSLDQTGPETGYFISK